MRTTLIGMWILAGCSGGGSLVIPPPEVGPDTLVLNELLAVNEASFEDPDSGECTEFDDWIELYNASDEPVMLRGLQLSDDPDEPDKAVLDLDGELGPGERLLLHADDDTEQGATHLPFKLSGDGESVVLHTAEGRLLDRVDFPALPTDLSWGRTTDGGARWGRQLEPTPGTANRALEHDPCLDSTGGFDDHSVPCLSHADGFFGLADARAGTRVVKFDVLDFQDDPYVIFLDGSFYSLHDEWYIFRMLNGQSVEGEDEFPTFDGSFDTIDAIYGWAAGVDLDALFESEFLKWAGARLTSQRYYQLALQAPRVLGAGVLIHQPADDTHDERWMFELEHGDEVSHDELVTYFEALGDALPAEIHDPLIWIVRSPHQEEVAQAMEADQLAYHDRIIRYGELAEPGEVEVYNDGLVAGRIRRIRSGEPGIEDAQPGDILILEDIPDYLPPCRALITAVPQTPLAHINLLASSRGIPNLYLGGVIDDPEWDSWARVKARVALRATGPNSLEVVELTSEEYLTWLELTETEAPEVPPVDPESWDWTVDLLTTSDDEMLDLRPGIGGKAAGFLPLVASGVEVPDAPLAVSIRSYDSHVRDMSVIDEVLATEAFQTPGDPRERFLVLEGEAPFSERYLEVGDEAFLEGFLAAHPVGEAVGDLVRAEGLRGEIAVAPLPAEVDGVLSTVEERFAHLAPTQGLRFRSSSNVEDIEGFNGAGLYASYSGFIHPENDPDGRTVSWAMRQVWASYWGFEAFEERHLAGIDHRAGAMAVLVHPRFDDTHELANGVVTGTRMPPGGEVVFEMVVNAGPGAISVTNPPTDPCYVVLPEVSVVTEYADGSVDVERMQGSTELIEGEWVLTEDDLLALLTDVSGVVERWIGLENDRLLTVQRRSTLTLDLEFRTMDQGWPALKKGEHAGPRLVLKQARSLEPSTGHLPDSVTSAPFPRDVLARAVAVEEVQCRGDAVDLDVLTATTNPLVPPDLGYAVDPFVAAFQMTVHVAMPFLGVEEGANLEYDHLDGELWLTADPWSFGGTLDREAIDLDEVVFDLTEGTYLFSAGETSVLGEGLTCSILTVHASEDGYLSAFFDDS